MQVGILIHWRLYCIQFLWLTVNASLNTEDPGTDTIYIQIVHKIVYIHCLSELRMYLHTCLWIEVSN